MASSATIIGQTSATTPADMPLLIGKVFKQTALEVNVANTVHADFAENVRLGKHQSSTTVHARIEPLGVANPSPINSISYNESDKIVETPYTITARFFEKTIIINFEIKELHENPNVGSEAMDRLRTSMEETIDQITRDALEGAQSYLCTSGTVVGTIKDPIERDFQEIETILVSNDAPKITRMIPATTAISTEAVEPCYVAIGHTDLTATLRNVEGFINVKDYSNSSKLLPAEMGTIGAVRILLTSRGKKNSDGTYNLYVIAKNAYHTLAVGEDIFNVVEDPRSLRKYTEMGYRINYGARITNPLNIIKMICARI